MSAWLDERKKVLGALWIISGEYQPQEEWVEGY